VDSGADLLVVSGSGDQAAGVLVTAVLLDLEPVRVVGAAAVPDWTRLTVTVRDGLRSARRHRADPAGLLEATGAGAVAQLSGLLAQAATRRTPVLLDGSPLVAAGALVAGRLAPGASAWWLAGQSPPVPAARAAHAELRLEPLLDLRLGLPTGADLAADVLLAAVDLCR
jgi:nicotinate-nucleotide--dimethylbenzimidazole phosphoribosyltransferase